ncbi:putative secretion ATPase (PEP-CTERM system associated) [Novosphingobium sp. PhB57]|uniref:XrtA/PEP-CTERM system-associated ATPase n=1 Tax=Novosphingobium sp. PhB57 TaxID=2485107 RepID=UPI00105250C8|nr:XrtA/PEP-CTERM system-associated ATPase [Novosphingobium sp. PhB57]TCU61798.1 putative secretion ATPase (PEP-CTERM system associated) [Novosphingobium sp. PhB57]
MFEQFYGFEGRPFQLTPDPAFYFESATHRKALSYLGYGLAQGEGFVVITGEVGAGKSTLVSHLMATIDPARLTAACVVTSALDGEEIVHVVAQAFGLQVSGHDKASALGAIETFLHSEARAGRRCLLIVDEAQNLSVDAIEELRMLSNFQLGSHPLLQTLLLGQPEFRTTLLESNQLEQLRQRVIATHHLTAMEPREVQAYVEHRLNCVGWKGNPGFDNRVFAEVHEATGGIPRRINQIVNRLLLLGAVEQRALVDLEMLADVLAELDEDGTRALVSQQAPVAEAVGPVVAASQPAPAPVLHPDALDAAAAIALIESALAGRDSQIDELQHAVLELAANVERQKEAPASGGEAQIAALQEQLAQAAAHSARLEARLEEQERTLRHTLTMLIEWFEGGEGQRQAA